MNDVEAAPTIAARLEYHGGTRAITRDDATTLERHAATRIRPQMEAGGKRQQGIAGGAEYHTTRKTPRRAHLHPRRGLSDQAVRDLQLALRVPGEVAALGERTDELRRDVSEISVGVFDVEQP